MRRFRLMIGLLLCAFAANPAAAGCDAVVSLVDFGRLDLTDGGDITGELTVKCDRPERFAVSLSEGFGAYRLRRMRNAEGAELRYNLYTDSTRRRIWGDGITAGTATIKGKNNGRKSSRFTIYGIVPSGQKVQSGPYRDNLVVSLVEDAS